MSERDHKPESRSKRRPRQGDERLDPALQLEALGRITRGAAHDFTNILASVVGNASLALSYPEIAPEVRQALEDIERAAQRASRLARQLLACSGKGAVAAGGQNLSRLIEGMDALIEASVPKHLRIDYELPPELPPVDVDPTELARVLVHLVVNGGKACEDLGGVVQVSTDVVTREGNTFVRLSVSDDGEGMNPSAGASGRRFGLAAVAAFVERHGGAVAVESGPDRGTMVHLLFPA